MSTDFTTYSGLQDKIKRDIRILCKKNQLSDLYPEIEDNIVSTIALAEKRLNRNLRIPSMEKGIFTASASNAILIPSDFLQAISVKTDTTDPSVLEEKPWHYVKQLIEDDPVAGDAQYFARQGPEFIFYPAIADSTRVEVYYYASEPDLSDSNTSNYWSANASDLLLSAVMEELAVFIDPEAAKEYGYKYLSRKKVLQSEADRMDYSGSSLTQNQGGNSP